MADLAPAENIAVDYAAVKQAFAGAGPARFIDLSGRLTFDERKQITAKVEALAQKTNGRAWVLALPGKTDVNQFAKIHDELKLGGSDLFFVYSQGQRHLHNKTLGKDIGNDILKKTNPTFYKQATQVQGILDTIDEFERRLATAAPQATTPGVAVPGQPAKKTAFQSAQPFLIVAVVAVVVWIALRRKPEPPKRPSLPKAKGGTRRSSRPNETPVPGETKVQGETKSTTGSKKAKKAKPEGDANPEADETPAPKESPEPSGPEA